MKNVNNIIGIILIAYFGALFVILAFLWKYLPIWESVLLGIWAIASLLAGYFTAWLRFKFKSLNDN